MKTHEQKVKEAKEIKKEISKDYLMDVMVDVIANNETIKQLREIDPTTIMLLTMFGIEIIHKIFDEDNQDKESKYEN